jgi:hypothetical protein
MSEKSPLLRSGKIRRMKLIVDENGDTGKCPALRRRDAILER